MKTKNEKRNGIAILIVIFCSLVSFSQAQPGRLPGPPHEQVRQLTSYSGKIARYVSNEDKKFDGLILTTGSGDVTVRFPAHMAKSIMGLAKAGTSVNIEGAMEWTPRGVNEVHLVTFTSNGKTILDVPPTPVPQQVSDRPYNETVKIADVKRDLEGEVNGVFLSDNTIVNFPKHVAYQFASTLKPGSTIGVQGSYMPVNEGEVFDGNYKIVEARVLSVNGSSFLIR